MSDGSWEYNGSPTVVEDTLAKLRQDDPDTWYRSEEHFYDGIYYQDPVLMQAQHEVLSRSGIHYPPMTEPLRRRLRMSGGFREILNMHTGVWEAQEN